MNQGSNKFTWAGPEVYERSISAPVAENTHNTARPQPPPPTPARPAHIEGKRQEILEVLLLLA